MKVWGKRLLVLLTLAFLISHTALAELKKGDSGYEVIDLQTMLLDTGFLFSEPDGKFGKQTEQAVKNYQQYAGMEVTGIVTDEVMDHLTKTWHTLMNEFSGDELENNGGASDEGQSPPYCNQWTFAESGSITDYCDRHRQLIEFTAQQYVDDDMDKIRAARALWKNDIIDLYDEWISLTPEEGRAAIEASRALFLSHVEMQYQAIATYYKTANGATEDFAAEYETNAYLQNHAAWLCQMVGNLSGSGEE